MSVNFVLLNQLLKMHFRLNVTTDFTIWSNILYK